MTGYTTRDGRSWTAHWEVGSVLTRGAGRQKQKAAFAQGETQIGFSRPPLPAAPTPAG
jgi:hypothetical protein